MGVFSDEFVEIVYGRPPVVPLAERIALVSHVRGVDAAVVHDESTAALSPDVTRFAVAGDAPVPWGEDSWLLQPARRTASVVLREALLGFPREEVA